VKILYLFGPNLGALGTREPETYGTQTLDQIMATVTERGREMEHDVSWRQSDHEGELVGWFHGAGADGIDAIVVNPGALTHYSYALRDAIEACGIPVLEVHMTNIHAREEFRRTSVVAGVCRASIIGLGAGGYHLALEAMPWITE
jgi:3-dehydroquinate dehydratase-2